MYAATAGTNSPDITYGSLAKAFNLPLEHDQEVIRRMWVLASESRKAELAKATPAQKEARERMALFPTAKGGHSGDGQGGPRSEVIFVQADKWVPVVRLGGKVGTHQALPWPTSRITELTFSFASFLAFLACSSNSCLH